MAWDVELIPATYKGVPFETNDFDVAQSKKGAPLELPQVDGAVAQDLGNSGKEFNLNIFMIGDDYKAARDVFELILQTNGPGILTLPTRDTFFNVQPLSWVVNENINRRGGRADFVVRFKEVIIPISPLALISEIFQLVNALDSIADFIIDDFVDNITYATVLLLAQGLKDFTKLSSTIANFIEEIVDGDLLAEFQTLKTIADNSVPILINTDNETLCSSYVRLLRFPGIRVEKFSDKIDKYDSFVNAFFETFDATLTNNVKKNQAIQIEAFTSAAFVGLIDAANNAEYTNRDEISSAIERIKDFAENIQTKLDDFEDLFDSEIASNQYRQSFQTANGRADLLTQILIALNNRFFELSNRKELVLSKSFSIVRLVFEIYGNLDRIDEFIELNTIIDPTLIIAGTKIFYYE